MLCLMLKSVNSFLRILVVLVPSMNFPILSETSVHFKISMSFKLISGSGKPSMYATQRNSTYKLFNFECSFRISECGLILSEGCFHSQNRVVVRVQGRNHKLIT